LRKEEVLQNTKAQKVINLRPDEATQVAQSVLVKKIYDKLSEDYAEYEILDVLEAIGPCLKELMKEYYSIRIKGLGLFHFKINKPRKYFNVHNNRYEYTDWSYTPTFDYVRDNKREIQDAVKELHVQTLRQAPDYVLPDDEQVKVYEKYLGKLGNWYENKLSKFTRIKSEGLTELNTVDDFKDLEQQVSEYKRKLDERYERISQDIKGKIKAIRENQERESKQIQYPKE